MVVLFSMLSTALRASFWMLPISSEISLVDCADFSASLRTSSATTANPRPCSPARAASMAAFKASRLVCSARSSITSTILPMLSARVAERVDDLARRADRGVDPVQAVGRLFHGADAAVHLFPRTVRNIEQNLGRIRDPLDRSHHLVDGGRGFADARGLGLRALHHVLHVHAHLVHGAGHFIDGRRSLQAVSGRLVGSAGHLGGSAGHLGRRRRARCAPARAALPPCG